MGSHPCRPPPRFSGSGFRAPSNRLLRNLEQPRGTTGWKRQLGAAGDFGSHVGEGATGNCAGHSPDDLALVAELVTKSGRFGLQNAEPPVDVTAIVQPGNRLLPWIATLREADVRLVEPGLGREDTVVELVAVAGRAGLDAHSLELRSGERRLHIGVEHPSCR